MNRTATGKLWIVATPIGNLEDMSARARSVLQAADLIAAEDTRHSGAFLRNFGIATPTFALHEHNERDAGDILIQRMRDGAQIALICDAGTPLISDPGFRLVRAARAAGIPVSPIPGACAAIAALSVAGLASDRFVFEGFLPAKSSARKSRLETLSAESRTLIFYESSHRIADTMTDMADVFGAHRSAVIARELTKVFETILSDSLGELAQRVAREADQRRGEFVVLIAGAQDEIDTARLREGRRVFGLLRAELAPSRAAKLAAEITGAARKDLYALAADA